MVDGQFVVAAETTTDLRGRFVFDDIPADPDYVYLAGADWQTVHYPGPRIRLSKSHLSADIQVPVYDAVQAPNPLLVRQQRVIVQPQQDVIHVTETLLISNPSRRTYVGTPKTANGRATTLTLSIPSDFTRATFHDEFFGRRFTVIDGKLVTDIPWTPGARELGLTYVIPCTGSSRIWQRSVDLPTFDVQVRLQKETGEGDPKISKGHSPADQRDVVFVSQKLQRGDVMKVLVSNDSLPIMEYARWGTLAGLLGTALITLWCRRVPLRYWVCSRELKKHSS
jgi:hypothetical protein